MRSISSGCILRSSSPVGVINCVYLIRGKEIIAIILVAHRRVTDGRHERIGILQPQGVHKIRRIDVGVGDTIDKLGVGILKLMNGSTMTEPPYLANVQPCVLSILRVVIRQQLLGSRNGNMPLKSATITVGNAHLLYLGVISVFEPLRFSTLGSIPGASGDCLAPSFMLGFGFVSSHRSFAVRPASASVLGVLHHIFRGNFWIGSASLLGLGRHMRKVNSLALRGERIAVERVL